MSWDQSIEGTESGLWTKTYLENACWRLSVRKMDQDQPDKKETIMGDEWENESGVVDMEKDAKVEGDSQEVPLKSSREWPPHLLLV